MQRFSVLIVIIASVGITVRSDGATVHLTPTVTGVYNEDFSPTDSTWIVAPGHLRPRVEGYVLQVDVNLKITGLGGSAVGFSNTAFNTAIHGNGAELHLDFGSWWPDNPCFDPDPLPAGNLVCKWSDNNDFGPDFYDLQGVLLAVFPGDFQLADDPRRFLGQRPEGEHAGMFFVKLSGAAGSWTSAEILADFGASTFDETLRSTTAGNDARGDRTPTFFVVPEPTAFALIAIGAASAFLTIGCSKMWGALQSAGEVGCRSRLVGAFCRNPPD